MKARYLLLITCVFPVLGSAQDRTAVSGPVAGYVFDQQAKSLRPVVGVPGAAYLGAAALDGIDAAGVSPDGSAALIVSQGKLALVTGLKSQPAVASIDSAIEGVDRIAWSADGASAAVYASASRSAQMLRKLNEAPEAGGAVDLSGLAGEVTALASAAEGVLVGVADEAAGGVYLAKAGAAPKPLAAAARPSGIALAGADLYFTDKERGQVWQVAGYQQDATPLLFAEGLGSPVGVQAAGKRLFVANAADSTLGIFDVETRALTGQLALDAAPAMLVALGGRALWLLNTASGGGDPLYVLDGGIQPAVYFVPAGRSE